MKIHNRMKKLEAIMKKVKADNFNDVQNYLDKLAKSSGVKEKNIKGVVFSHGHLDHIGAAAILLNKLGNPQIIGRPLTLEMVKHRVEDTYHGASKKLKTLYVQDIKQKSKSELDTEHEIRIFQNALDFSNVKF